MTPEQQLEAVKELAEAIGWDAARLVWKNRSKVHHTLTKYGRLS